MPEQSNIVYPTPVFPGQNRRKIVVSNVLDLLPLADAALDWVVQDLLLAGGLYIMAGPPKVAQKTIKAMALGMSVSQGIPFLGKVTSRRPVVYTFLEDGEKRVARRLRALGAGEIKAAGMKLDFWATFYADGYHKAFVEFQRIASAVAGGTYSETPALWIIDSFVRWETLVGVKDENNPLLIEPFLEQLRQLIASTGITIVLIHHFRKTGDRMRGSSALEGATDGWWDVTPVEGQRGVTKIAYTLRDGESGVVGAHLTVAGQASGQRFVLDPIDLALLPRSRTGRPSPITALRSYVAGNGSRSWRTKIDICVAADVGQKNGSAAIDELLATGELVRDDAGYHAPAPVFTNGGALP